MEEVETGVVKGDVPNGLEDIAAMIEYIATAKCLHNNALA
jgi:hypothetical protein